MGDTEYIITGSQLSGLRHSIADKQRLFVGLKNIEQSLALKDIAEKLDKIIDEAKEKK